MCPPTLSIPERERERERSQMRTVQGCFSQQGRPDAAPGNMSHAFATREIASANDLPQTLGGGLFSYKDIQQSRFVDLQHPGDLTEQQETYAKHLRQGFLPFGKMVNRNVQHEGLLAIQAESSASSVMVLQ